MKTDRPHELTKPVLCKYCGSQKIVKYGYYKGVQRWWCKECRRKFADNRAFPKMKAPAKEIALALSMYNGAMPLKDVCKKLKQQHGYWTSESTIYNWLVHFSRLAVDRFSCLRPKVGDEWLVLETTLKTGRQAIWLRDIIDRRTHFLMASRLSFSDTTEDMTNLLTQAIERVGKVPNVVYVDKLQSLSNELKFRVGGKVKQVGVEPIPNGRLRNLVRAFYSVAKSRKRFLHRIRKHEIAELFVDSWLITYDFFRVDPLIGNCTPATRAEVNLFPVNEAKVESQLVTPGDGEDKGVPSLYVNDLPNIFSLISVQDPTCMLKMTKASIWEYRIRSLCFSPTSDKLLGKRAG